MRLTASALLVLVASGCYREYVVTPPPDPLTAEEIVELTRQETPPEEIIRRIDESRTVYRLDTGDILELSQRGVDPKVIEHMRLTRERDLERRARRRYWYPHPYYPYYPYYGFGYYCW